MDPLQAWQHGVQLAEAVSSTPAGRRWERANASVAERYDRLRTDPRSPLHDRADTIQRLQAMASDWDQQVRDLDALRADLQARLGAGRLLALGFERTSAATQRLVAVPPPAWRTGTVDWARSALDSKMGSYADIRVLPVGDRRLEGDPGAEIGALNGRALR